PVIGEVELLRIANKEVVGAEVRESELGPDGAPALRPVAAVAQLPARGADEPFAEFDPPAALAELPCLRCHHDGEAMSLPNPSLDPQWREPGVLRRAQRSASALLDR
ncbi:MAG: hypothetical protein KC486_18385, partial [Myxococcales bacterium]|nr:hypothetical protein [Myxococcales bacterium]